MDRLPRARFARWPHRAVPDRVAHRLQDRRSAADPRAGRGVPSGAGRELVLERRRGRVDVHAEERRRVPGRHPVRRGGRQVQRRAHPRSGDALRGDGGPRRAGRARGGGRRHHRHAPLRGPVGDGPRRFPEGPDLVSCGGGAVGHRGVRPASGGRGPVPAGGVGAQRPRDRATLGRLRRVELDQQGAGPGQGRARNYPLHRRGGGPGQHRPHRQRPYRHESAHGVHR